MVLRETGFGGMDLINLFRIRFPMPGSCKHDIENSGYIKGSSFVA
jgi:hypothetical protein